VNGPRIPRARPELRALPGGKPTVQTPAPPPAQRHPEDRLAAALRQQYLRGFEAGERTFYTRGWRRGLVDGCIGTLAGACLAAGAVSAWFGGWRPW
jgi:hypothetical protein